jgi:hypothetical protein
VYVAILARAPSPRANRVARRIAASPERFRGDDENAALDANVPAREAFETFLPSTPSKRAMDFSPFELGHTAGRTNEPSLDRSRDDRGDASSSANSARSSPRVAHRQAPRDGPKDETEKETFSLEETLRSDIAAVRDEIRALSVPERSSLDEEEDGVARVKDTRSSVSGFETPATTRRVLRRLDVHMEASRDARADSNDDDDESRSPSSNDRGREERTDDEGDVRVVVPKSLLRRAICARRG